VSSLPATSRMPDRRLVPVFLAEKVIDDSDVEAEWPVSAGENVGVLSLMTSTELVDMEEDQVDVEVGFAHLKVDLAADERERRTELAQRIEDAVDMPCSSSHSEVRHC
jgi:hypothetical protein